jgi:autotransporter-associated beta strand protein
MRLCARCLAVLGVFVSFSLCGSLFAAPQLYWDPGATNSSGGGTGTWNTQSWWNGTGDVGWSSGNDANFGGATGTVTLNASISAADLNFTTANYLIQSSTSTNTLTLTGGSVNMAASSGTITSIIAGSAGLYLTGTGNLWTGGANTVTGGVFINSGSMTINGGGGANGAYNGSIMYVGSSGEVDLNTNDSLGYQGNYNWLIISGVVKKTNAQSDTLGRRILLSGGTMTSTNGGGATNGAYNFFNNYMTAVPGTTNYITGAQSLALRGSANAFFPFFAMPSGSLLNVSVPLSTEAATAPLLVYGAGAMSLSATSSFTGNTVLGAGSTLYLMGSASIGTSAQILVGPGALFDVSGLNSTFTLGAAQSLAAGRASSVTPGTDINGNVTSGGTIAAAGSLTINGALGLTGGAILPSFSSPASTSITTSALTLNGTTAITPSYISNGTFTVLQSTAAIAGAGTVTLGNPIQGLGSYRGSGTGSLSIGSNSVSVTYSGLAPATLTWNAASSNLWNLTQQNWLNSNGGTLDVFFNGDAVIFPVATPLTSSGTVGIASGVTVYPSSMTFSNSGTIVLSGTGTISGPATLLMNGTGVLQFAGTNANTNSFWGGTTISSGTIELGNSVQGATQGISNFTSENPKSLGSGPITINGGQLRFYPGGTQVNYTFANSIALNGGNIFQTDGHQFLEGPLSVGPSGGTLFAQFGGAYNSFAIGSKTLTVDGVISGSGPLYLGYGGSGTGNFFIDSANPAYTGTATIAATTVVYLASASAFPNAYMNSLGGTIGFETTSGTFVTVDGAVACPLTTTLNSPVPGLPVTLTVGAQSNVGYSGVMSGSGALVVKGGGTFAMITANNTFAGGTTINGSVLEMGNGANESATSLGSGSVSIINNGMLHMAPGSSTANYLIANAMTLNGGTIWQEDGNQVLQGSINIGANGGTMNGAWGGVIGTSGTANKTLTIAGNISGSAPLSFGFGGPGGTANIFVNNANSYSGTASVNNNTILYFGNSTAFANAGVYTNNGGTLSFASPTSGTVGALGGTSAGAVVLTNSANAPVSLTALGNNTYSGVISGLGGLSVPAGTSMTLANVSTFSGTSTISGGSLIFGTANALSGSSTMNISSGALNLAGFSGSVGAVNMSGGIVTGSGGTLSATTMNVNSPGGAATLDVIIAPNVGATITAGTLTTTTNGQLLGNVTIKPGGVWDVSAYGPSGYSYSSGTLAGGRTSSPSTDINGNLNVASAVLAPSASSTLSIAGNLGLNGGTLAYASGGVVAVGGALNATGADVVSPLSALGNGTYTLFTYNSGTPSTGAFSMGGQFGSNPRQTYTFSATPGPGVLTVSVSGFVGNLVWNGGTNQTWDTGSSTSWLNLAGGTLDKFYTGDNTTFNDTPGTATTVNINAVVFPGSVTVNNTAVNYTFSGTGSIAGATSLVKNGPGSLTLSQSNSYIGGTAINNGIVILGTPNALPVNGALTLGNTGSSGQLNLNGVSQQIATLSVGSGANAATQLVYNDNTSSDATLIVSGGTSTFAGQILDFLTQPGSQTTSLQVTGSAYLSLTGSNSFTGASTINGGGTLQIGNGTSGEALGAGIGINDNGTLIFNHADSLAYNGLLITGSGTALQIGSGTLTLNSAIQGVGVVQQGPGTLNLNGGLSLGASIVQQGPGMIAVNATMADSGSVTQQGTGTILMTQANTYTGATSISSGTVLVAANNALGAGNLNMTGGVLASSDTTPWSLQNALALGGSVTLGDSVKNGALTFTGASNALTANTVVTVNSPVTVNNAISGTGFSLNVRGPSILALNGQNTFTGATTVNSGTLQLNYPGSNAAGALASPTITVNPAGYLALNAQDVIGFTVGRAVLTINDGIVSNITAANRVTFQNTVTMTGGTISGPGTGDANGVFSIDPQGGANGFNATSDAAGNPAVINSTNISLQSGNIIFNVTRGPANPAADMIIASTIRPYGANTNGIVKSGSGILELTGSNTYTGVTTVTAGTLVAVGPNVSSTNSTTVSNGMLSIVGSNSLSPLTSLQDGVSGNPPGLVVFQGTSFTSMTRTNDGAFQVGFGSTVNVLPGAQLTTNGDVKLGSNASGSSGSMSQSGGTVTIDPNHNSNRSLTIGEFPNEWSAYSITNGLLNVTGSWTYVPWNGGASLNVSGGSVDLYGITNSNSSFGTLNGAGGNVNLSGNGAIYLGSGGINPSSGTAAFFPAETAYNLNGGTLGAYASWSTVVGMNIGGPATIDNGGYTISLSGNLSGTGALTVVGTGTLNLTGNNTFSGATLVKAGTVNLGTVGANNGYGALDGSSSLTIAAGAFVNAQGRNALSVANHLPVSINGGTLNANDAESNIGALSLNGGALTGNGDGGVVGSFGLFGNVSVTGSPTISANYITTFGSKRTVTTAPGALLNWSGTIFDGVVGQTALNFAGSGTTILSGSNTYSGGTTVSGGIVNVTTPQGLADGSSLTVGNPLLFPAAIVPPQASRSAVVPVPEPSTLVLSAVAVLTGWSVCRRRNSAPTTRA